MNKENMEKAVKVLGERLQVLREFSATSLSDAASKLDSAGLLITPLHERALKACEDLVNDFDWSVNGRLAECCAIGRESLAEKKAKESWTAEGSEVWLNGRFFSGFQSHAQARAVAAALNALEVAK